MPQKGQTVQVHCTGRLSNGNKFWSTKDAGQQPFEFQIGLGKVMMTNFSDIHFPLFVENLTSLRFDFEPLTGYQGLG